MDIDKFLAAASGMRARLRTSYRELNELDPGFLDVPIEERLAVAILQAAIMLEQDGFPDPFADIAEAATSLRAAEMVAPTESEGDR